MKNVVGFVIGLVPVSAFGECVPVPDCASIGYTETSCDGDSLKCPFDTSKLYCVPCDSSFKYSCEGDNIVSTIGDVCNNKYVSCECVAGATFNNGECICDTSCSVGNIYYSDGTCSSCVDENKAPVGIVVKDNRLVLSIDKMIMTWANTGASLGLTDYRTTNEAITDMAGKENSQLIVNYYINSDNETTNAALYCSHYMPNELPLSAGNWYLASAGEMYQYLVQNYSKLNNTYQNVLEMDGIDNFFWTSTEYGYGTVWVITPNGGTMYNYLMTGNKCQVPCLLEI